MGCKLHVSVLVIKDFIFKEEGLIDSRVQVCFSTTEHLLLIHSALFVNFSTRFGCLLLVITAYVPPLLCSALTQYGKTDCNWSHYMLLQALMIINLTCWLFLQQVG